MRTSTSPKRSWRPSEAGVREAGRCSGSRPRLDSGERMFESRVLGVDPGLARLGLAVVEGNGRKAALIWAGVVETPAGSEESERLRHLCLAMREAISVHRPA